VDIKISPLYPTTVEGRIRTSVMNGNQRASIKTGMKVAIVLKADQHSGKLTHGVVKDILTNSPTHPHGIKVRLVSGAVGRVKEIKE
jgi:uncharacterized repeat protein (TIGR03833 family)